MTQEKTELLIGVGLAGVFALLGLGMIVLGWQLFTERAALRSAGIETQGTIVGFERVGPGPPESLMDTHRVPRVRFRTATGLEITFLGTVAERFWTDHRAGQTVTVVYPLEAPEQARIDELAEIWFAPSLLLLVGLGAVLIPPYTLWRHVKSL